MDTKDEMGFRQAIEELDVVLDFSYPTGQLHDIIGRSKDNIKKVFEVMKAGSMYFYMSSIMAYGMRKPKDGSAITAFPGPLTHISKEV